MAHGTRQIVKRCVGGALVILKPDGVTSDGRCRFRGEVRTNGHRWSFSDLSFHAGECGSARAFDRAADEVTAFASNYTTDNRGDDVPDWAPPAKVADAIDMATSWARNDRGDAKVRRGPCRFGRSGR